MMFKTIIKTVISITIGIIGGKESPEMVMLLTIYMWLVLSDVMLYLKGE